MLVLPGLHRPDEYQVRQLLRKHRKHRIRQAETGSDGANVEIGWSPATFLDVERIHMTWTARQIDKDTTLGCSPRVYFRFRENVNRPHDGIQAETGNCNRPNLEQLPSGQPGRIC